MNLESHEEGAWTLSKRGPKTPESVKDHLAKNIQYDPNGGCWLWSGGLNKDGYGHFSRPGIPRRAHRAAWTIFKGKIPTGIFVLHKCDVRACCNPDHLFLGTPKENMDDMDKKGRRVVCTRETTSVSKITTAQAQEILVRRKSGERGRDLAREYGVSEQLVCCIYKGRT